jgi:hypothetical protein
MSEDPRCCGSGTCIIDTEGRCWCGRQWDGRTMGRAAPVTVQSPVPADVGKALAPPTGSSS